MWKISNILLVSFGLFQVGVFVLPSVGASALLLNEKERTGSVLVETSEGTTLQDNYWGNLFYYFHNMFLPKTPDLSKSQVVKPGDFIWSSTDDISSPDTVQWESVDDVVMGGASKSNLDPGDIFNGTWTGIISTARSGT